MIGMWICQPPHLHPSPPSAIWRVLAEEIRLKHADLRISELLAWRAFRALVNNFVQSSNKYYLRTPFLGTVKRLKSIHSGHT